MPGMLTQAVLLTLVGGILGITATAVGQFGISRPLVISTVVGWLLGNLPMGLTIGATLELIWMGVAGIGAAVPPNIVVGSLLASSFAIMTGQGVETALAVAVPAAMAAQSLSIFYRTLTIGLMHWAEKQVEKGKVNAVVWANLLGIVLDFLTMAVPLFPAIYFGVDAVKALLQALPPVVTVGLKAAGGMLPAVGFGMLLNMVGMRFLLPYFFAGFAIATFLKVPLIGIAVLGLSVAFLHDYFLHRGEGWGSGVAVGEQKQGVLARRDLRGVFLRTFFLQSAWNYERMQNLGWAFTVLPALKKFYHGRPEDLKAAVKRHLEFFNTHPYMASAIIGPALAMEEELARGGSVSPEAVSAFKVGTMGPLAGVGDSLFWLTIRPICFGLGVALAQTGNVMGPVLAVALFNIPHLWTRYYPLVWGYRAGASLVTALGGGIRRLSELLGVLGMTTVGAMTATMVSISTKAVIKVGQAPVEIQKVLDAILPNLLPLAVTWGCYVLLRRRVSPVRLVLALIVLGILGAWVKFFS